MKTLYQARVHAYLRRAELSPTTYLRGRYYENLLCYLLESVPGCRTQRNTLNHYGTEEADISVGNERIDGGLRMLPEFFIVECKNWTHPVDSTTVGYFVNVVADRGCELGILAAASGITGSQEHRNRAYNIGSNALIRRLRIIVITADDLRALTSTADFVELLHSRNLALTAHGTIHLG